MTGNIDLNTPGDRKFTISNDNLATRIKLPMIKSNLSFQFVDQLLDTTPSFIVPAKQAS